MKVQLKTSWDGVTIKDYMMIHEISQTTNLTKYERENMILGVLSGVDSAVFNTYPFEEVDKLIKMTDFIYTDPIAEVKDYYFIDGKRYKLTKNLKQLNASQFIDLSNLTKDDESIKANIHTICATLLLPAPFEPAKPLKKWQRLSNQVLANLKDEKEIKAAIKKIKNKTFQAEVKKNGLKEWKAETKDLPVERYGESDVNERADNFFDNMAIADAFGVSLFFCLLYNSLLAVTQHYLVLETKNQLRLASKTLSNPKQKKELERIQGMLETGFNQSGLGLQQYQQS